jgi:hypothetical protein
VRSLRLRSTVDTPRVVPGTSKSTLWPRLGSGRPKSQFVPGQQAHKPVGPVIAQAHDSAPLYVHVQVEPEQSAAQTSPTPS